jgi:hypothetical protein
MILNYAQLPFRADGTPETPQLLLKTLGDEALGVLPGVSNLHLTVKFAEPSEISFDLAAVVDGERNWAFDTLTGYMLIWTEYYGVYVVMSPDTEADGIGETMHVTGYSIEKLLETKRLFLDEGTYKFYNTTNPTDTSTLMGLVLELAVGWTVKYVSPSLAQRYRTFDEYDDELLSFLYETATETYRAVFSFDPYNKYIYAYDADEELEMLPIYLGFDNLLSEVTVEEISDELVTAIQPYGADSLDIREVNPIGTNWIYDISYFISKGDVPAALAAKWKAWQALVQSNRSYYEGLCALRATATAELIAAQAALTDLNGERETLEAKQSVTVQALAMETTTDGKSSQQAVLTNIYTQLQAKNTEIATKEAEIETLNAKLDSSNADSYAAQIAAMVQELGIRKYFTDEEYAVLQNFFIEDTFTESSFVATDLNSTISGEDYDFGSSTVQIAGSSISKVDLTEDFKKTLYVLVGGTFSVVSSASSLSGDVIRGTLEVSTSGDYVMSLYGGSVTAGTATASSATMTVTGKLTGLSSDIAKVVEDEVTTYEGTKVSFSSNGTTLFLTANISDYQQYAVKQELYDYAVSILDDVATPTYEFEVDSGNFLFAREFAPFRDELALGKGIYLNLGNDEVITPYIIEFELDFEDRSDFSLVFSNRFKRHDNVNTLKDMIEQGYSSGRSFDASKYLYTQAASQASQVSEFMSGQLESAVNTIIAASDQSVVIDGAGIHVYGTNDDEVRISNGMIAMSDDAWQTAKLAIGRFQVDGASHFGVNAEVLSGKLIIGNNMVLENELVDENNVSTGVMQFKVDSSGAWLNNSTFVLQKDNGGKILIDPQYGILAGTKDLFDTNGTTVLPSFIDSDGDITTDNDGLPTNSNFFLDLNSGDAYFRGTLKATGGKIGGFTIADDFLYADVSNGNYVAMNGSGTNDYSDYAFWAGAKSAAAAPFSVMKDGTLNATNGTFSGTLSSPSLAGNLTTVEVLSADGDSEGSGWLDGLGIRVGENSKVTTGYNFYVDGKGNVTINGDLTISSAGAISWANLSSDVTQSITDAQDAAAAASEAASSASSAAGSVSDTIDTKIKALADGSYTGGTLIDGTSILSPQIYGAEIYWGDSKKNGTYGSLTRGEGSDGVSTTNIVELSSNFGMVLSANTNIRFEANAIWFNMGISDIHITYNNSWYTLTEAINYLINQAK